jgi:hypothetical protein
MRLSPELDFLRACCLWRVPGRAPENDAPEFPAHVRELSGKISKWSAVLEGLALHGVDSLAYARLQEAGRGAVPDEVMAVLADRAAQNAASSLRQISDLADVLDDLSAAGVKAVPFRGPLMSSALYGNSSLSRSADLELVIRGEDRDAARTVLELRGYVLEPPVDSEDSSSDAGEDRYRFEGTAENALDVRWRMELPQFGVSLDLDYLLPGCRNAQVAGVKSLAISPEDLPIALCAHGAKHGWKRWVWLCDLDASIRDALIRDASIRSNPGLDWRVVSERATALGLGRVIRFSLILAHELLETPVPERILEEAREDEEAVKLAAEAGAHLLHLPIPQKTGIHILDRRDPGGRELAESAQAHLVVAALPNQEKLQEDLTAPSTGSELVVRAYRLSNRSDSPVPAPRSRTWMDQTDQRFANRCLPLLMANQAGWHILNTHTIEVEWDGRNQLDGIRIRVPSGAGDCPVHSHFGHGIVTWSIPFLFRTSPGYNLWARGPANSPKDGACPLEGLVETDWSPATFTMNWQMTRPGHMVRFEEGEPICCVVPQRRGELEEFDAVIEDIGNSPEENERHEQWAQSRKIFLDLMSGETRPKEGWQKHYFHGEGPAGERFEAHQNKLKLRAFRKPGTSPRD